MDWGKTFAALLFAVFGCILVFSARELYGDGPSGVWSLVLIVVLALVGALVVVCALVLQSENMGQLETVNSVFRAINSFFDRGVFYIALGCLFLLSAYGGLGNVHSAFVFLLAILGVAIVLYGTGTQAAGTGNTGTVNVAIAGGAGVLAAVFGFGVLQYGKQIQDVFKGNVDYGVLSITSADIESLDFEKDYDAIAELSDGSRLHMWRKPKGIEIIVPIQDARAQSVVILSLNPKVLYEDRDDRKAKEFPVNWSETRSEKGAGNEQRRRLTRQIQLRQLPSVTPLAGAPILIAPQ